MAWQTDYCIMKEGMSILGGRKSVPGISSNEREMERKAKGRHEKSLLSWKSHDTGRMSILGGRKSVPGINGRERGNGKEKTTGSSRELHDKELV
nr:hypothetical protein [Tanacetum cinerariifolium]